MANPVITICREGYSGDSFEDLERTLSMAGLHLRRPGDDAVFRLSAVGDQIPSSRDEVLRRIQDESRLAMNFWLDDAVSAFVSTYQVSSGVCCETVSIDILDDPHKIAVSKALIDRFRHLEGRRMIVVDLFGQSFEVVDWVSVFLSPGEPLPQEIPTAVSPTVLGIDLARFEPVAGRFGSYKIQQWDGIVLASRPANLDDFPAWRWERYKDVGSWVSVPPA